MGFVCSVQNIILIVMFSNVEFKIQSFEFLDFVFCVIEEFLNLIHLSADQISFQNSI